MSRRVSLWQLSVATTPAAEDAVAATLGEALGLPTAGYTNALTGRSRVTVFLEKSQLPEAAAVKSLRAALRRIPGVGSARVEISPVRREDWTESWKKHFPPIEVSPVLLVRPSWSRRRGRRGQAVVTIDPGLSFGTGQHATTAFCLAQLARAGGSGKQSCLDIGTGSGILAIAAARLGYAPVAAFDFDADAVRVARANAQANEVIQQIRLRRANVLGLPRQSRRKFDVVCANLLADLLLKAQPQILAQLAPGGKLLAAGILRKEFAAVQAAYERAGLKLVASKAEKEWRSGAFAWAGVV
jgi:ribosomal protein L11 methyltransferase